ncbi:MAG: hypothetical protein P8Z76_12115 [Alphaproteobacteria bacterium]
MQFEALGRSFRLLIAYSLDKEQYRATLGVENARDLSVVASYEFHGTHPGWHVQAACGDIDSIPAGMMRGPWQSRFPKARRFHRRDHFGIKDDSGALDPAAEFFRLHKAEGKML